MGYDKKDCGGAVQRINLVDEVYERLRWMITSRVLKPGERLNKIELCDMFQVSRAPLREAIQKLAAKGLLKKICQKGTYVISLEDKDIQEIYNLREYVETLAIKDSIKNIPENKLLSLKEFFISEHEAFKKNPEYITSDEYVEKDMELHFDLIINYSDSMILKHIGSNLFDFAELTSHISLDPGSSIAEHIKILDALLERNKGKTLEAIKEHFSNMKEFIISELEKSQKEKAV